MAVVRNARGSVTWSPIDSVPAKIRVLHGVFSLGERTEHAIGQAKQVTPVRLEAERWIHHEARLACDCPEARGHGLDVRARSIASGAPLTTTRERILPCPIAYFTVGYMLTMVASCLDRLSMRWTRQHGPL